MDKRHSSPSSRTRNPRPRTHRKRSNSFPISDALGCSTPEAELILAEGRAALRSRLADRQRGRPKRDDIQTFRPKDHIGYLVQPSVDSEASSRSSSPPASRITRHNRIPSDATDRSTSTIIAPNQPTVQETSSSPSLATSPLGDYSAQLASFIRSQLNSIPTYTPGADSISPRSCPDLSFARTPSIKSPALSPAKPVAMKRHVGAPSLIEIPSIRPPARSAFSAWSSTDDETDDEAPPLPLDDAATEVAPKAETYTPSVLRYYEHTNDSSFLFSSTPLGDDEAPDTTKTLSFPAKPAASKPHQPDPSKFQDEDYPSSDVSGLSLMSTSSAPSLSSISTGSYFENRLPLSQVPNLKNRIIAAVTPPPGKVIPAISPFEGADLSNVHDILVQSQQRILVDGMSFDMVRDFTAPDEGMKRYQTPC